MGKKVIHGGLILRATLASGSGHDLLTVNPSTGEVGSISGTPLTTTLTAGSIFLGNASNVATATAMSGDISIDNTGVTAISAGVIVNADVNTSAAIAHSKMAALTASRALVSDGSGVVSVSATTSTELGYVSGVTSAIQTQLNGKQATITGAATTITSSDLTANRALISGTLGKVEVSSVTNTELGYLSGVSSNIQTQFSGKLSATIAGAAEGDILYFNGTNWVNLPKGTDGQTLRSSSTTILWDTPTINGIPIGGDAGQVLAKQSGTDFDSDWTTLTVSSITDLTATAAELNILDGATITVTELNFLDNASANIQDQLNNKMSNALTTDYIFKGVAGVATASTDLPTGITIGGAAIYRAGGSDVALGDGGTGASLSDPGADRIMFWDDSAGQVTWLTVGSGLSLAGTTLSASSSGISGTLTANRIPYATGAGTLSDDSALTWDATNNILTTDTIRIYRLDKGVDDLYIGAGTGNTSSTGSGANTAIGHGSMVGLTTGNSNTSVGRATLTVLTTGTNNTALGDAVDGITTGSYNTLIGVGSGGTAITGSRNVVIGAGVLVQNDASSGQLSIQNAIFGIDNTATGTSASTGKIGVYVASPTASLDITASTTSKASLRIRSGSAPATPNDGDIWFDGTNLCIRIAGVTKTFTVV